MGRPMVSAGDEVSASLLAGFATASDIGLCRRTGCPPGYRGSRFRGWHTGATSTTFCRSGSRKRLAPSTKPDVTAGLRLKPRAASYGQLVGSRVSRQGCEPSSVSNIFGGGSDRQPSAGRRAPIPCRVRGGAGEERNRNGWALKTEPNEATEWTPRALGVGLLERSGELARIEQAIAALGRGHGGVLIVQGSAGIGKTSLLRAVCEQAAEQGVQTFSAQCSELEREFGFGVVRQLLEMRLVRADESERAELLAGAAALAAPVLGLDGTVGDSFATLHGLYWLVANLAASGPAVLTVDDLHWADEPSLHWLVYLCRRLEELPVLVVVTTRPPRPMHSSLLAELLVVGGVEILCPDPLSEPAVGRLIGQGLGTQPDAVFVSTCAKATGGNPFALHELILELAAGSVAPLAAQAGGMAERVPAQVERVVLARLGRLNQTAVDLAQAVAVLGDGSELRLAAVLAELNTDAAATAADALVAAELLAEGWPLRFVHPLVRSAIYEQLAPGTRAQAHARAAQLLTREGAKPEQVAAQLLAGEPAGDSDAVQALQAAAAVALARGAPETAITYLRRALAEPPKESERTAVLGEMGGAEKIARDPAAAVHLEQAWQDTTDPIARARLANQLANVLLFTRELDHSLAMLQAGLDHLDNRNPELAVRLHIDKATLGLISVCSIDAPDVALKQLHELATQSSPASRSAQLALAGVLAVRGENCREVAELVNRGWDDGRFLAEETSEVLPAIMAVLALTFTDELDHAHTLTEAMLADARARGSVAAFQFATGRRGLVALRRGALAEAEADTRAALELATEHHLTLGVALHATSLGLTLLERGELDQAANVLDGVPLTPARPQVITELALLEARGRVRLARGQRAQGIADLRHCGQLAADIEVHNPNLLAWRSTLALALAPKHPREARELAVEELELARRVGAPRAIGIALRAYGLLTGGREGIELLQQSVAVLELSPARLELAYSLTELGAALRRAGARTAAREPLRRALDIASRCGATPLVQRAREESLAAGARPRRPWASGVHALTPSELRVATLAAQSLSNREIAQALFITTKTVSDHLTSAYRKLNISSRDRLATAMTT
jgi:DNA-binding CsgD family transcriptional regulator